MQGTRPNEIRRPGVRLHPKASAALRLEAERATPKRLGTPVPRTCKHALGTGYASKSAEPLGLRPKEGTCASTGAQPPGETSMSRWRRTALPVLPGAALLGATSQVQRDVSRLPSSCAEPLPVRHRGDARGNHGAPLHDRVHLPTYLPMLKLGAIQTEVTCSIDTSPSMCKKNSVQTFQGLGEYHMLELQVHNKTPFPCLAVKNQIVFNVLLHCI